MEDLLIRVLPACLTDPLPVGWDAPPPGYVVEVMPEVERPEVVTLAVKMTEPDILLLDADFPEGDPFDLTGQALASRSGLVVVILSQNNAPDRLRRAMLAGAEEYLIKPLDAAVLRDGLVTIMANRNLRSVASEPEAAAEEPLPAGIVVGIVSGKGGLGKTTVAANLAALVAKTPGKKAGLVGLESGDGAILLSLQPRLGLLDIANEAAKGDVVFAPEWLRQFGSEHRSGLYYWGWQGMATQPGAGVPEDFFAHLFDAYRRVNDVTLIDFPLLAPDEVASVLPLLDIVILVSSSSDLLALRSSKTFLDLVPPEFSQRVRVVINRADTQDMISRDDFEQALERKVAAILPNEPQIAAEAINMGSPFVLTQPHSELATTLRTLGQTLFKLPAVEEARPRRRFMLF